MINENLDYLIAYLVSFTELKYKDLLSLSMSEVNPFLFMANKKKEIDHREKYELMRLQTYYILAPNMNKKVRKLSDFMPFAWDERKVEIVQITETEYEAFDQMFSNRSKRLFT